MESRSQIRTSHVRVVSLITQEPPPRTQAEVIPVAGSPSGPEQHLDGAAFIHGAVALGNLHHGQFQVEHLAGVDLPVP